ncbi:hypothetical protein RRG08_021638 [Elysia crispata]|uniref:RRM domain-containing protein n=1 Tax=Elysia crispata TaxID=231223 RepID=A0AAE0XEG6_9GAST|nr:hypothetical protein RRG08_021638 [Elysia crispata]
MGPFGGYRVYIGDIGRIKRTELEREFGQYGPVIDVWMGAKRDMVAQNFAFVVFRYPEDAEEAVNDRNGREVCGRTVRVEHARPAGHRTTRGNFGSARNFRGRPQKRWSHSRDRSDYRIPQIWPSRCPFKSLHNRTSLPLLGQLVQESFVSCLRHVKDQRCFDAPPTWVTAQLLCQYGGTARSRSSSPARNEKSQVSSSKSRDGRCTPSPQKNLVKNYSPSPSPESTESKSKKSSSGSNRSKQKGKQILQSSGSRSPPTQSSSSSVSPPPRKKQRKHKKHKTQSRSASPVARDEYDTHCSEKKDGGHKIKSSKKAKHVESDSRSSGSIFDFTLTTFSI